jgi:hypothetical protein
VPQQLFQKILAVIADLRLKARCQMLSDREQRGPRWGVAESRVLTQSNRLEVRQFCSWAEQINQLQLPLGGIFLVEQTKWAWSASRSDRPDLSSGKSRFNRFAWNGI